MHAARSLLLPLESTAEVIRRETGNPSVEFFRADLSSQAEIRRLARDRLRGWPCDQALAGLRDPAAVADLPAGERDACRLLWADVRETLARAQAAAVPNDLSAGND